MAERTAGLLEAGALVTAEPVTDGLPNIGVSPSVRDDLLLSDVSERTLVPSDRQLAAGAKRPDGAMTAARSERPKAEKQSARDTLTAYVKDLDPRRIEGPRTPLVVLAMLGLVATLDDYVFAVILPELRAEFAVGVGSIIIINQVSKFFNQATGPLTGFLSDRVKRVRLIQISAIGSNLTSILAGFTGTYVQLAGLRALGGTIGGIQGPSTVTLLPDYYEPEAQGRVLTYMPAIGQLSAIIGPLAAAGALAFFGDWRLAVVVIGAVATLAACSSLLLKEPPRGVLDRLRMGASADVAAAEAPPLSMAESFRAVKSISTVRRFWYATPFLSAATSGTAIYLGYYWAEVFGLTPSQRGLLLSLSGGVSLVALVFATPLAGRLLAYRPGRVLTIVGTVTALQSGVVIILATSQNLILSVAVTVPLTIVSVMVLPAVSGLLLQVIPAHVRGFGLTSVQPLSVLGGVIFLLFTPLANGAGGTRALALAFIPFQLVGGYLLASAAGGADRDIRAARAASVADEVSRQAKLAGTSKLLVCRDVDVTYDGTQVLFGVDFDIEEGQIVALLGTNGAGKSTLLKAISGMEEASNGAIFLDGRDITHEPAHLNAASGIVMVPGGHAVFPTLTVDENLRAAGWLYREDDEYVRTRMDEVLGFFPILRTRSDQVAGNLSGGEQQMVALGQAFLMKPRLLMIDELSLGLAPVVVEQLLEILRAIHAQGTTIALVEQSLNVALTIADRAVFMEKGEIRFDGNTEDLLQRPDLVRSVFMGGGGGGRGATGGSAPRPSRRSADDGDQQPVLEINGISVDFGGVQALRDVSLSATPGEIVGIIGPNGAGKTTLFDVVSGFVTPATGSVVVDGQDITGLAPDARARLGLGRSFQNVRLFPSLTVRENIAVAFERRTVKSSALAMVWAPAVRRSEARIFRRVDGLIDLLGLKSFATKFVSELSTGSRRAVEVACIMAAEPQVLLLDEPSSGLAQAETEELGPVLQRVVQETGCAMLVIEHDIPLITSVSDTLVAMELGEVLTVGRPEEVVNHPKVLESYLSASESVIARSGTRMAVIAAALGQHGSDGSEEHDAEPEGAR